MLKKGFKISLKLFIFLTLTVFTQIGGIVLIISEILSKKIGGIKIWFRLLIFTGLYVIFTMLLVPKFAMVLGREQVINTKCIRPTNYMTILLNRNYVKPELNVLLKHVVERLKGTGIKIQYLDANFPFIDKFPLLPHLSHNDGKKIDLSLVYETKEGKITSNQKSNSGYGVFVEPKLNEVNQVRTCIEQGYFQYDYPKYLTLGTKHQDLLFSKKGTKTLIEAILQEKHLGKLFIEPHLKTRLNLNHNKVRYHGCRAVRHDDHIHIQLK